MKKVLFLVAFSVAFFTADAQRNLVSTSYYNANDTVTNTGSKIWFSANPYKYVSLQLNVLKISGTVAGSIVPVGSNDGVYFYPISKYTQDTVTAANTSGTVGYVINVPNVGCPFVGLRYTGSGTMSASATGTLTGKQ